MYLRRAKDRGHPTHIDWLKAYHTFSFGSYFDPNHMGHGPLRVINDDVIAPGAGFATHGHKDMEIISYIIDGGLQHKDSMGNGSVIKPGEIQIMSAGTGVRHSEFNANKHDPCHSLQMWVLPKEKGIEPAYEQKDFNDDLQSGEFVLTVNPDGRDGSLVINQDANLWVAHPEAGQEIELTPEFGQRVWVHMATGQATVRGKNLRQGDGLGLSDLDHLVFSIEEDSRILVFDMNE